MQSLRSIFLTMFELVVYYISAYFWEKKKDKVSEIHDRYEMLTLKATDIVKGIKEKRIKSKDFVKLCIERIETVDPIINAVTDKSKFTDTVNESFRIDDIIEKCNADDEVLQKPLLGLPFTVQESIGMKAMPYTFGLISRKHLRCSDDAPCIKLLKDSGAIPLATTNIPEIDMWCETRNNLYGGTYNPHHTGKSVGGSGGAEAALVAAFGSPFGICKNVAGSALMAASYCGVFAYCPTPALTIGLDASKNKIDEAIIARNVDDLKMISKILCRQNSESFHMDMENRSIEFYYINVELHHSTGEKMQLESLFTSIKNNVAKEVKKIELELDMDFLYNCWLVTQGKRNAWLLTNGKGKAIGSFELMKKLLGVSRHTLGAIMSILNYPTTTEEDLQKAKNTLIKLREKLTDSLKSNGVLLLPAGLQSAPDHYTSFLKNNSRNYFSLASLVGFPAVQVPIGLDIKGMPLGIEVITAPFNDSLCLEVAAKLENIYGGLKSLCLKNK